MMATLPDGTQIEVMPVTRAGQVAAAAAQAAAQPATGAAPKAN